MQNHTHTFKKHVVVPSQADRLASVACDRLKRKREERVLLDWVMTAPDSSDGVLERLRRHEHVLHLSHYGGQSWRSGDPDGRTQPAAAVSN